MPNLEVDSENPAASQKLAGNGLALSAATLLAACGGGSGGTGDAAQAPVTRSPSAPISDVQAARFLVQAAMGATRADMQRVQDLGYAGWLDEQLAMPPSPSRWDWLVAKGFNASTYRNTESGWDAAAWRKMVASPDTLRQRVTLALSEILVGAIDGFIGGGWRTFSAAAYLDLLEANAFGTYRNLLQQVSTSAPMGEFLTYRGNVKYNAATGALPDENYAREIMQLFSIGLIQLNVDGTPKLSGGKPIDTYSQDDVMGLARVFTGWDYDLAGGDTSTPDFKRRPMKQVASRHETGEKSFLGITIPAGTDGAQSLQKALDCIASHPNVAPFISRQLIQRLVTSNPTPAYVGRVAMVFIDDGQGARGNLKAVIKAILLDDEARNPANTANPAFGKLREPMLRFTSWARAFQVNSPGDSWPVGNTSDPATRLGQSPLRSATVFNFFRPGYAPPSTAISSAGLVAPEFQITNESSVVGYINFMQKAVANGINDLAADYAPLLALADNASALLDELNIVLAAGRIEAGTLAMLSSAVDAMPRGSDSTRKNRIHAALVLVLAAPDFIVQK
ncbi:Uncharacterized conserved protein, DUF1800 family [Noviherbaspirillum humi]|uniref:Uncharacterized conserved protein, DUF1800 family n=2 Tax=Noviherbaspirillum humi TaxID=1688639 RepID=A0A239IHG5_9BURK|nr:Uncharacterized conserved protein, DUF1800 family [Noviherbaspirillum humi]